MSKLFRLYLTYLAQLKQIPICMRLLLQEPDKRDTINVITMRLFLLIKLSWRIMVLRRVVAIIGTVKGAGFRGRNRNTGAW